MPSFALRLSLLSFPKWKMIKLKALQQIPNIQTYIFLVPHHFLTVKYFESIDEYGLINVRLILLG